MLELSPIVLARAAESRRRALPATAAFVILAGGLAAAILGQGGAIGWAMGLTVLLVADAELYRRLDEKGGAPSKQTEYALAGWAMFGAAIYSVLPVALWLEGSSAACAAALALWVAGAVRQISSEMGGFRVMVAGAAPPIASMALAPSLQALASVQADWDAAMIALLAGAGLIVFVARARRAMVDDEMLNQRNTPETPQQALAEPFLHSGLFSAVLLDRDMRIVAVTDRAKENWGLQNAIGKHLDDACPWRPMSWPVLFQRVLSGECLHSDCDELNMPIGRRFMQWEARPWRAADGAICGVAAYGRDVSAMVQAQAKAQAAEARLRMALEAGRSVAWDIDVARNEVTWHGDPTPIFGHTVPLGEFFSAKSEVVAEEDLAFVQSSFEACIAGRIESFEHRIRHADGQIRWVAVWARVEEGDAKNPRRIVGLTKDVTARKHQEESFLAAMSRAQSAIRAKRAMLVDKSVAAAAAAPSQIGAPRADASAGVSLDNMFTQLDALLDEMDARDALLSETLDSLRGARETAENASIAKSRFLASMSHELRTPLNAIIGYSEILLEDAEADGRDSDQKDLGRVLAAARQLLGLINEILDLSKIEAGRMDVSLTEFNIKDLIQDAVETVRPMAERNNNAIAIEVESDLGAAESDALKITQCLLNLLSNASKFTKDGAILVKARREKLTNEDWIEVAVEDSGIGMSGEQQERVFLPYEQAEKSTSHKFGGTGLGLAITRRIMQLLGGDVTVTSVLGKGSTFMLRWPARLNGRVDALEHEEAPVAYLAGGQRVVVVDDEENARDLVARALGRIGIEVKGADNGAAGIALARAVKPSLIIVDINLPDISGWEVIKELRADPDCAGIPVLVHSVDDDRRRAMALGACEHLVKPADRDVLAAVVTRIVRPVEAPSVVAPPIPAVEISKRA